MCGGAAVGVRRLECPASGCLGRACSSGGGAAGQGRRCQPSKQNRYALHRGAWGWGSMGVVSLGYERCWCMRRAHGGMWCMRMRQWGCQCQRAGPATCAVCLSSIWACGGVYACGASSRAACAGEWQPAAHSCVGCKDLQGLRGTSRVSHTHPSKHCWRGSMGCVGPLRLVLHSTRH